MRYKNYVEIVGRLGQDPERRFTPTGRAMTRFRVAVTSSRRDETGAEDQRTEWFRVCAWDRLAEEANAHLHRRDPVQVIGRLENRSCTGDDGQERYITELVATELYVLPQWTNLEPFPAMNYEEEERP